MNDEYSATAKSTIVGPVIKCQHNTVKYIYDNYETYVRTPYTYTVYYLSRGKREIIEIHPNSEQNLVNCRNFH